LENIEKLLAVHPHLFKEVVNRKRFGVFVKRDSRRRGTVVVVPDFAEIAEQSVFGRKNVWVLVECVCQPRGPTTRGTDHKMEFGLSHKVSFPRLAMWQIDKSIQARSASE